MFLKKFCFVRCILLNLLLYLSIGTLAMLIPIMLQGNWYELKLYKRILVAVLLTISGTVGTFLMYYVESGRVGGTSFFGAVFFVPIIFFPISKMLATPHYLLMDICAPAECAMLVIMKMQCLINNCCGGKQFIFDGKEFIFPSQIIELINAAIICCTLLYVSKNNKMRGAIYPLYMIIYGITRFILNLFRDTENIYFLPIPFGNFWSLMAIIIGIIWLFCIVKNKQKE